MSVKRKTIKRNPRECGCMDINRNASLPVRPHYRPSVHKTEKVDLKAKERHYLSLCLEKEIRRMNVCKWRCGVYIDGAPSRKDHRTPTGALQIQNIIYSVNPVNPELNPICYLLALLGAHHFLHVSRIRVKLLTFRLLMPFIYIYIYIYIYGAPIVDVSRSLTTTQHSR